MVLHERLSNLLNKMVRQITILKDWLFAYFFEIKGNFAKKTIQ